MLWQHGIVCKAIRESATKDTSWNIVIIRSIWHILASGAFALKRFDVLDIFVRFARMRGRRKYTICVTHLGERLTLWKIFSRFVIHVIAKHMGKRNDARARAK